jgi:hypothetical protein
MDMLIILLKLFKDGPQNREEFNSLRKDLDNECPPLLHTNLQGLTKEGLVIINNQGRYVITGSGINALKENKKLQFIFTTMNWMDQLRAAGRI